MNKFLIIISACITFNAYGQTDKWEKVTEKNTVKAYQKFIKKYPDSKYSSMAKAEIAILQFKNSDPDDTTGIENSLNDMPLIAKGLIDSISKLNNDLELAACYAKAAELSELTADKLKEQKKDFIELYKKAGFYYNKAAIKCLTYKLHRLAQMKKTIPVGLAIGQKNLSARPMYNKCIEVFQKAGYNKQVAWLKKSGKITPFEYENIIEEKEEFSPF